MPLPVQQQQHWNETKPCIEWKLTASQCWGVSLLSAIKNQRKSNICMFLWTFVFKTVAGILDKHLFYNAHWLKKPDMGQKVKPKI